MTTKVTKRFIDDNLGRHGDDDSMHLLHRVGIEKLLTQHVRRRLLISALQWRSALLVVDKQPAICIDDSAQINCRFSLHLLVIIFIT